MTPEEKAKIFSQDEMIASLKLYVEIVKQVLPAVHANDEKTISAFNKSIENRLQRLEK